MSSLGGSDRQVSDFPVLVPATWSPDNRYLVAGRAAPPTRRNPANGLYLIPVQGGEPRSITRPPAPGVDRTPTFSPDGHRLAYISCEGPSIGGQPAISTCWTWTPDSSRSVHPGRCPSVPTTTIMGLAWSGDGKSLIFGAEDFSVPIPVARRRGRRAAPERIEMAGVNAVFPSIAPGR